MVSMFCFIPETKGMIFSKSDYQSVFCHIIFFFIFNIKKMKELLSEKKEIAVKLSRIELKLSRIECNMLIISCQVGQGIHLNRFFHCLAFLAFRSQLNPRRHLFPLPNVQRLKNSDIERGLGIMERNKNTLLIFLKRLLYFYKMS